ncbi:acyl-CoA dehydrogenase family protein [Streptomyces sp. NPDC056296]|uniref:acyl-CoA dehydrogenase family protein n=1 Tax=Streptomyces sp. NPDC056296 TaxID=3345775 RepID=UPI0035DB4C00
MTRAATRPAWSDDEGELLREVAAEFLRREAVPQLEKWAGQGHVDPEFWARAGELGLLCASIPQEYGGGGGSITHDIVVLEEISRAGAQCFGNIVHSGIVAHYLLSLGTEQQKRQWLPRLAAGTTIGSLAMSEPGAGSDVAALQARAVRDGDEFVLSGSKTFITNGGTCGLVIVAAKTDPSAGSKGVSLLLVDADSPGFRRGRVLDKIGLKGQDTAELFFDEVRVPADQLLGRENQGFAHLMANLRQERLLMAVEATVQTERAVALGIDYTKQRHAFGAPLSALQHVRFELAECSTQATVNRTFVDDCIVRLQRGELDDSRAAMAKYWSTDTQGRVIDRVLQLFGGYGYMREYPIAQLFTDSRVTRIAGGTNEIMREIIARSL